VRPHRLSRPWQLALGVLALVVIQAAGVVVAVLLAVNAANRATASRASTVQLCRAGNEARAEQLQTWAYLVRIAGPPQGTPAQQARAKAEVAAFIAHLHKILAPRNCTKLAGQAAPPP
jgi:hypothetical protein